MKKKKPLRHQILSIIFKFYEESSRIEVLLFLWFYTFILLLN